VFKENTFLLKATPCHINITLNIIIVRVIIFIFPVIIFI